MQTLGPGNDRAANLYWLALLLTGRRERRLDVAIDALDFHDSADLFFSNWMLAWSRRLIIAKALAAIRDELSASARLTALIRPEKPALPPPTWALDSDTTKVELERALLAIDVFPRCALLLSIFEGVPVNDAAILLDSDPDLVRKGQAIGLQELTRNLARMQDWTSVTTSQHVVMSEMQHA